MVGSSTTIRTPGHGMAWHGMDASQAARSHQPGIDPGLGQVDTARTAAGVDSIARIRVPARYPPL